MTEHKTSIETITNRFAKLRKSLEKKRRLEAYFSDLRKESGIEARQIALEEAIEKAEKDLEGLQEEFERIDPDAIEEYNDLMAELDQQHKEIKNQAYQLPDEQLSSTNRIEVEGVGKVTISKASSHIEYDPRILEEIPGLMDMDVDGDPVVERRVNSAMLQRLVATGAVPAKVAEKYGTSVRPRNPSVKVEWSD